MHGYIGLCIVGLMYGYAWLYKAMCGHTWLCRAWYGLVRICEAYVGLCTAINDHDGYVRLCTRATQREYSSKTLKHSIVKSILVFKR